MGLYKLEIWIKKTLFTTFSVTHFRLWKFYLLPFPLKRSRCYLTWKPKTWNVVKDENKNEAERCRSVVVQLNLMCCCNSTRPRESCETKMRKWKSVLILIFILHLHLRLSLCFTPSTPRERTRSTVLSWLHRNFCRSVGTYVISQIHYATLTLFC